jgi:DNA modification methylase
MGLITRLADIVEAGRQEYLAVIERPHDASRFVLSETIGKEPVNLLARSDNLDFMEHLLKHRNMAGKIDLIYIDPPFFSKSNYRTEIKLRSDTIDKIPAIRQKAYHDVWDNSMEDYLRMLTTRLFLMRDLLSDEGSIFVHLDWHATHYVKLIMDEIFGEKNFVNEIIWQYKSGGVSKRHFARKHDTLLFYAKTKNYYFEPWKEKSYNRDFRPYRFKGVKEYKDEVGWYTMVNRKDVWKMDMVGRTSTERTGYVTQKPEALIERILESCTVEGSLCADLFGGSGTMAAAADKMGRRWISCDVGRLATLNSHKRLMDNGASYELWEDATGQDAEGSNGTLDLDATVTPSPISDKMLLRVELLGYNNPSVLTAPVEPAFIPTLKKIMKQDSLQLVDYWSVDTDHDGKVFRPKAYFCKQNDGIETAYEALGNQFSTIAVKAVDIFGNSGIAVLEPETIQEG